MWPLAPTPKPRRTVSVACRSCSICPSRSVATVSLSELEPTSTTATTGPLSPDGGIGSAVRSRWRGIVIQIEQPLLDIERRLARRGDAPRVAAIGVQLARVDGVAQVRRQHDGAQVGGEGAIVDPEHRLHPPVEVALHEVGAAQVDLGRVAAAEGVDAAVLEEAADDADDAHRLAPTRDARPQAAGTAHDEVNVHA